MLSHDLARELLARRNNDVRVQVLVDDDPSGETHKTCLVELRDQDPTINPELRADPVVSFDPYNDVVVIRAGIVVLAEPEPDAWGLLDEAMQPVLQQALCRCDWLGQGTPEHVRSGLCREVDRG